MSGNVLTFLSGATGLDWNENKEGEDEVAEEKKRRKKVEWMKGETME